MLFLKKSTNEMFSSKPILDKLFDIEAIFGNKLGQIYIY